VSGLIHVGAWDGAEYRGSQGPMVLFEPLADAFAQLQANLGDRKDVLLVRCALGAKPGTAEIYRSTPSHSSSLLSPKEKMGIVWPEVTFDGREKVRVSTLDDEMRAFGKEGKGYERLILDVQGYELEVLKGAKRTLHGIDWIKTEVSWVELYEGGVLFEEINGYLNDLGFRLTRVHQDGNKPQGDAYYRR